MKKIKLLALFAFLFLFLPHSAKAQVPSFDCSKSIQVYTDVTTGNVYSCKITAGVGTWMLAGGGGGAFGPNFVAGGGTAQAQTVAPTIAVTNVTLVNGYQICWLPIAANTGAAPTLAGSGTSTFSAKPITKYGTVALVANDITTAGIACAIYDGTEFQLQVPLAGGVFSSSISAGSGASAAGATATGGFAAVEAASTGWTPTAGQDYCRADSTLHSFVCAENGAAEVLIGNVNTGQTNVYGAFLQDFTAGTIELPEAAGFTTNVNSTIGLDTTANTCKVWVNSADAICAVEAAPIAAGFLPKSTDASHGLLTASLCDEGITTANTLTCANTAGIATPFLATTGSGAGYTYYGQGADNCVAKQPATSACWEAPVAVTSYRGTVPASAPSGLILNSNAASVVTQSSSGDSNHAVHVTAQTATKTIYTICPASAGGCNVAGQYRVTWYFNQGGTACGTPTPGQVTFALSWTDNAGAHSAIALPMNDNSSIAVFTSAFKFAATNVTGFASGEFNLWSTGAQPIQVTNTYTACGVGTGTWELTAAVEQVQ